MRLFVFLLTGWLMGGGAVARADEQLVEDFDGHNSLTTSDFTVPDGWEIRWHSGQVLSIGVIELDHTVVAGATGRDVGSLFVPQGGHYRIVVRGADPIPWDVKVYALGPVVAPPDDSAEITYYQPTPGPGYKPPPKVAAAKAAPQPAPAAAPSPPPPPTHLDASQLRGIVTVRGERTQGSGFFLKTGTGTVVVTTLALLSNNPNLDVETATGSQVAIAQIQAATDRDVAMISVKDFGYPGFEAGDPDTVRAGDRVLTSAKPDSAMPVVSVSERSLDVDGMAGQAGAPVVLAGTGKAVAVVSMAPSPFSARNFNKESFADRETAREDSAGPRAVRFDNVADWETCAWARLQNQTLFLDDFRQHTRALDSYLNGRDESGSRLWRSDPKIVSANDSFVQNAAGGDMSQRVDALRQLLFELGIIADTDMEQITQPANFYVCEQKRAQEEIAYRQALKAQLDGYNHNVGRFNKVASRNN